MRELAILTFLTLDGVVQSPASPEEDTSNGFTGGGWGAPYWEQVMPQVYAEAMSEPYDLLLGRKTYDQFASHWPGQPDSDPVAARLHQARKYVVSVSSKEPLTWENSIRINGNTVEDIRRLKREDGPLIQVHGSWRLIQTLHRHRLIDEYRLWTFPVVVGGGKHLFERSVNPAQFELTQSAVTPNGVSMTVYRRR